jgi:PAS domain S-box-containing protein
LKKDLQNGALLLAAYTAAAVLGLQWAQFSGAGSPVWPAFGIALAGLLLGGLRLWPTIFIGRLLASAIAGTDHSIGVEIAIALTNTVADTGGAWVASRLGRIDLRLSTLRDILWLAGPSVAGSAALSATLGASILAAPAELTAVAAGQLWLDWWCGNLVAGLTITPLILSWSKQGGLWQGAEQRAHFAACMLAVAAFAAGVFLHPDSLWLRTWHMFPVLLWAALAFGVPGASAALTLTSALALIGTTTGVGVMHELSTDPTVQLRLTQQFSAIASLTILALAMVVSQRRRVEEAARLTALVASTPDAVISYDAQGKIATWNEGAEKLFGYSADEVTGRGGELLLPPEQPQGLGGVFGLALEQGKVRLETVRQSRSGERIDVAITASKMIGASGEFLGVAAVMRDIRERKAAEASLRESRERLVMAQQAARIGTYEFRIADRRMIWSDELFHIYGLAPRPEAPSIEEWQAMVHPDDRHQAKYQDTFGPPEPGKRYDHDYRIILPDGSLRWIEARAVVLADANGHPQRYVGVNVDITERKKAEEHQRLLVDELNHRVKNTLSIVQSLAQQTFRSDACSPAARDAYEGRLAALSAAHNVLTRESWEHAQFRDIIEGALAPFAIGEGRLSLDGPDILLPPKTAVSFAMAFHELATNCVKHGSLSTRLGEVKISWEIAANDAGSRLRLLWQESGGPVVVAPARRGFGSRMIERGLAAELSGTVTLTFAEKGVRCEIDAPLANGSSGVTTGNAREHAMA